MGLGYYDAVEATALLKQAGFAGDGLRRAYANGMKESWMTPAAVNSSNANGTKDYGLFQFNDVWRTSKDPVIDFDRLLGIGLYNAQTFHTVSKGGTDLGFWGIGTTGWAGSLKKSQPDFWALINKVFAQHYDAYPARLASAQELRLPTAVRLANVKPGKRNREVGVYQRHLRDWLLRYDHDICKVNPTGANSYFGTETSALTVLAYQQLVDLTGNPDWLKAHDVPGPSLLRRIGLVPS